MPRRYRPQNRQGGLWDAPKREGVQRYVAEVRGRSCLVCGLGRAWFGFGPPLVPELVWTCRAHRANVDPERAELPDWLR
jgi:hypothetical protein